MDIKHNACKGDGSVRNHGIHENFVLGLFYMFVTGIEDTVVNARLRRFKLRLSLTATLENYQTEYGPTENGSFKIVNRIAVFNIIRKPIIQRHGKIISCNNLT